jgi:hypothetical protein
MLRTAVIFLVIGLQASSRQEIDLREVTPEPFDCRITESRTGGAVGATARSARSGSLVIRLLEISSVEGNLYVSIDLKNAGETTLDVPTHLGYPKMQGQESQAFRELALTFGSSAPAAFKAEESIQPMFLVGSRNRPGSIYRLTPSESVILRARVKSSFGGDPTRLRVQSQAFEVVVTRAGSGCSRQATVIPDFYATSP